MAIFRRAVGCTLIVICFTIIIVSSVFFGIAETAPEILPFTEYQQERLSLFAKIASASAVFIALYGAILADILGKTLGDIFAALKSRPQKSLPNTAEANTLFDYFDEPEKVLPVILSGPGLIADYKIPYQRRLTDRDITEELRQLLFKHKSILIYGIAGIGKTREAGRLLASLIDEGYTVLRAKTNIRLTSQYTFPTDIRKRIIFLFDDIHLQYPSKDNDDSTISKPGYYLDDIHAFLQNARLKFLSTEVHTIFIARSDTEAWPQLQYPHHPIWKETTTFEMPYPSKECQQIFIGEVSEKLNLAVTEEQVQKIAELNDGTFRNLLQNMYRAKRAESSISAENFTPRQGITWKDRYQVLKQRHGWPVVVLFATLRTLSIANVALSETLIIKVTTRLLSGSRYNPAFFIIKWYNTKRIHKTITALKADGDLILEANSKNFIVHEQMIHIDADLDEKPNQEAVKLVWENYRKLLLSNSAWLNLAEYTIFGLKQPAMAVLGITKLLRTDQHNAEGRLLRALALFLIGRPDWALRDADISCSLNPTNSKCFNLRGIIYNSLKKKAEAKRDFDRALELSQDETSILRNRSALFSTLGELNAAEKDLNRVISLDPLELDAYLQRARIKKQKNDFIGALQDLDFIIQQEPKFGYAYIERALLHIDREGFSAAEEDINKAVLLLPKSPEEYFIRAFLYMQQKKYNLAEDLLNEAIRMNPMHSRYYYLRSNIRCQQKKTLLGLQDADQAIRLNSKASIYYSLRTQIFLRLRYYESAVKDANQALEMAPDSREVYMTLAKAQLAMSEGEDALRSINRYIEFKTDNGEAYDLRGRLHAIQGRRQLALADFTNAIDIEPENHKYYIVRSQLHLDSQNNKLALRDIATARRLATDDPEVHLVYIDVYNRLDRLEDAKAWYQSKLSKDPDNRTLLIALSYIYALQKDSHESVGLLKKTIKKSQDDESMIYCQLRVFYIIRKSIRYFWLSYEIIKQVENLEEVLLPMHRIMPNAAFIRWYNQLMRLNFNPFSNISIRLKLLKSKTSFYFARRQYKITEKSLRLR